MEGKGVSFSKQHYRMQVWDYMKKHHLTPFPPPHHRIPNFVRAREAASKMKESEDMVGIWNRAECVKIDPDSPQKCVREMALLDGKMVLVPAPQLRDGLFYILHPCLIPPGKVSDACSLSGTKKWGVPVSIENVNSQWCLNVKTPVESIPTVIPHVDVIVVGSVAVSSDGDRIGKGGGYADIEWGILRDCDIVDHATTIFTTVEDCQVMPLPEKLFTPHDCPVDIIFTPTSIVRCNFSRNLSRRPKGILWNELTKEKINSIPSLRILEKP